MNPSMLPSTPQDVCEALARDAGMSVDTVYATIERLQEVNPMLGFRGCRLGITYPEITEMQARLKVVSCMFNLVCGHGLRRV